MILQRLVTQIFTIVAMHKIVMEDMHFTHKSSNSFDAYIEVGEPINRRMVGTMGIERTSLVSGFL